MELAVDGMEASVLEGGWRLLADGRRPLQADLPAPSCHCDPIRHPWPSALCQAKAPLLGASPAKSTLLSGAVMGATSLQL